MTLIEQGANWLKNRAIYMTGRGLVGLGLLGGVALFPNTTFLLPAAIIGTAAVQAFVTWRSERRQEKQLLTIYRDEVAAKLQMHPADVGISELKEVAEGSLEHGIIGNPVIQEALERNSQRHVMQFISSAITAVATIGITLFIFPNLPNMLQEWRETAFKVAGFGALGNAGVVAGGMFVAGSVMGTLNQIVDRAGERILGIHKSITNDKIMAIRRGVARGEVISQEQVFGVFVCAQPELAAQIEAAFGKPYEKMNPRQQHAALDHFGRTLPIAKLTRDINHLSMDAEELAFVAIGERSGVPLKNEDLKEEALKEKTTAELLGEVKTALVGESLEKPEETQAPANDNQKGFAARFVPRKSTEAQSFTERYTKAPKENHLETVLAEIRAKHEGLDEVTR